MKAEEVRVARAVLSASAVDQFLREMAETGYQALERNGFMRKTKPRLRAGVRSTCCWRGLMLAARCEVLASTVNLAVNLTLRDNASAEFELKLMNQNRRLGGFGSRVCDAAPAVWAEPLADGVLLSHLLPGLRALELQRTQLTADVAGNLVL